MEHGYRITAKGKEALTACLANGSPLVLTRVNLGSGLVPDGTDLSTITDLVEFVKTGEFGATDHQNNVLTVTVMCNNADSADAFTLNEFLILCRHPLTGEETPFLYATLGDYGQPIPAYNPAFPLSVWKFPIVVVVADDVEVAVTGSAGFVTYDEMGTAVKETAKKLVDNMSSGGIKKTFDFSIAPEQWISEEVNGFFFYADIMDGDCSVNMFPDVVIADSCLSVAADAGISTTVTTFNGYIRLRCVTRPASVISGCCNLLVRGLTGSGFKIFGHYPTVEDLIAVHPEGEAGDGYLIGVGPPYDAYLWDAEQMAWYNIGPVTSKGNAGRDVVEFEYQHFQGFWKVEYSDGERDFFAGVDETYPNRYSFIRDDMSSYEPGEDALYLQNLGNHKLDTQYRNGAFFDIVDEKGNKFLRTRGNNGARCHWAFYPRLSGEYTYCIDFRTDSGKEFLNLNIVGSMWAFINSSDGSTKLVWLVDNIGRVQTAAMTGMKFSAGVWYRIKIEVNESRVVMRIWNRDNSIEPAGLTGNGVLYLDRSAIQSAGYDYDIRKKHASTIIVQHWAQEAFTAGIDNIDIWRDMVPVPKIPVSLKDWSPTDRGYWLKTFTDGKNERTPGIDKLYGRYSFLRDNFSGYTVGKNLNDQNPDNCYAWPSGTNNKYQEGASFPIMAEGNNKFLRMNVGVERAHFTFSPVIGERTIQVDIRFPITTGKFHINDLPNLYLYFYEGSYHIADNGNAAGSGYASSKQKLTIDPAKWYRMKYTITEKEATLKVWDRDNENEPEYSSDRTIKAPTSKFSGMSGMYVERPITMTTTGCDYSDMDNLEIYR